MNLRGIELRYVLAMQLAVHGPATIGELIVALKWHGFRVGGRPSKAISDALRWEMERGRVRRLGRGRYGPGCMPRGTEHRIHQRVLALREAAKLSLEGGQMIDSPVPVAKVTDVTEHGPSRSRLESIPHARLGQQVFGM